MATVFVRRPQPPVRGHRGSPARRTPLLPLLRSPDLRLRLLLRRGASAPGRRRCGRAAPQAPPWRSAAAAAAPPAVLRRGPAQRRAPGASASAKGIPRSALRASVTPEFVTASPDEAVEVSVPSDAFRRTGGGLDTRARVLLGLSALRVSQELETGREISLQYVFNCKL